MPYKTMSIRIDKEDYNFVKELAKEQKEEISSAVRDLMDKGRIHLAIEEYKKGRASLGRASRLAGVSISEMIDILAEYGVKSNLDIEDYRAGLKNLEAVY
jgi:predicted HTH domain antitoxin